MANSVVWAKRLTVSFFSLVIFLSLIELSIRISGVDTYFESGYFLINRDLDYPDVTLRDSELFWKLRPNKKILSKFFDNDTIRTNALGFRGNNIHAKSEKSRIVALGNSCTFGWGIELDSTFTSQLQIILGGDFEIINAGVPGYSSYQGKVLFEKEIQKLAPDILLILFAWNDHWPAALGIPDNDQIFPPEYIVSIQNLMSRLKTYQLLRKLLLAAFEKELKKTDDNMIYRVSQADFEKNLKEICTSAKSIGALPILMTSPIANQSNKQKRQTKSSLNLIHSAYNEIIIKVANTEKVALVDLAEEFSNKTNLFTRPQFDPIHFNNNGHKLTANLVAEKISSLNKR